MTDLRDPRLHRVLDAAPDDGLRPAAQTRDAIRAHARAAVAVPGAPVRWWRQAWALAAGSGRPWNAALATLLVAGFVTVLWQGREVPPVAEPPPGADVAAPAAAPAGAAAPAPVPEPAPLAKKAEVPERAPAVVLRQRDAQPSKPGQPPKEAVADAPSAPSSPAVVAERMAPMAEARSSSAPAAPPASAPAPAAATAAPMPPAAPAPAPALRAAAPAAAKAAGMAAPSPAWSGWTHLRMVLPDRVLTLERAQVLALAALLDGVAQPPGAAPWPGALWRLELERQSEVQGVLEVGRDALRWSPAVPAGLAQTVVPDPVRQQALLDELARLAARQGRKKAD